MTGPMQTRALAPLVLLCLMSLPLAAKDLRRAHGAWALAGYDAVSYFSDGAARPGLPDQALKWRGQIWHFASTANRAAFEANPAAYQPQFSGYCVVSISEGAPVPGDPTVFVLHQGRLYLMESPARRADFARNPEAVIARAVEQWPALSAR